MTSSNDVDDNGDDDDSDDKSVVDGDSETKKAPKLNFLGKFCGRKSLPKFWPMGGQKKV